MARSLAINLKDDDDERLRALAESRHESPEDVAAQAVAQYLDDDRAFRAAVEEGLEAGRRGDAIDFADFAEDLRRRMAVRLAESEG